MNLLSNNPLRISLNKDPLTFDPQKCSDVVSSALIFLLFKGLMRLEANGSLVYDLADFVQISNGGRTYTFQIGKHYWSSGDLITAQDFVYSWKRALDPAFPLISYDFFYPIKNAEKARNRKVKAEAIGIHAKGSHTLVVDLEHPCPHFLELTSFCPLFPIPSFSQPESIGKIVSGSFEIQKYEENKEILLKRNSFCKNNSNGKIPSIDIKIISDEKEALHMYEDGKLDWIGEPLSPLPVNYLPAFSQEREFKPVGGIVSCFFNVFDSFFCNEKLRKSFMHALNLEKILQGLLFHNAFPASSLLPSKAKYSFDSSFNPSLAKRLFKEAVKEMRRTPTNFTLYFETTDINWRLAKAIKTNLRSILGIDIHLNPLSFKELQQRLSKGQFSMAIRRWFSQCTDPINILELFESRNSLKNISRWENSKYQEIIQRYRKTTNHAQRKELLKKAEAILKQECPAIPLCYCQYSYLQKSYLKNLAISPVGLLHFDQITIDAKKKTMSPQLVCESY